MRVSGDPADPDYWRAKFARVEVRLNGQSLQFVTEADDEEGYVVIDAQDGNGDFLIERGYFVSKRLQGNVVIVGSN